MTTGLIIKIISNQYTVLTEDKQKHNCTARGKFRLAKNSPVVGDLVDVDLKSLTIERILPRQNKLERPIVANIDMALIMCSVKQPELSLSLLDKLITVISTHNIEPIICFSKVDLLENNKEIRNIKKYYEEVGYTVFYNTELEQIKAKLKGKIVVVTGQTGAGKSTFLNKLCPSLKLETKPISEALNRGVHTTRHVELYDIDGIYFVDTPGFSALDLSDITIDKLKASFKEFSRYKCRYQDCNHDKELECNVISAVNNNEILHSRYKNYLLFKKEIYENSRKLFK